MSARRLTHPPTIGRWPISVTKWVWIASHRKKSKPQRKISRGNSHTTRANKGRSPLLFLNAINCELTTSEKRVGRWLFHSFLQNLSTVDFIKININELTNDHEGVTSSSRDHIKIIQNTTNHSYGAIMNCRSPRTWNDWTRRTTLGDRQTIITTFCILFIYNIHGVKQTCKWVDVKGISFGNLINIRCRRDRWMRKVLPLSRVFGTLQGETENMVQYSLLLVSGSSGK